jgi:hypothetical protein
LNLAAERALGVLRATTKVFVVGERLNRGRFEDTVGARAA